MIAVQISLKQKGFTQTQHEHTETSRNGRGDEESTYLACYIPLGRTVWSGGGGWSAMSQPMEEISAIITWAKPARVRANGSSSSAARRKIEGNTRLEFTRSRDTSSVSKFESVRTQTFRRKKIVQQRKAGGKWLTLEELLLPLIHNHHTTCSRIPNKYCSLECERITPYKS